MSDTSPTEKTVAKHSPQSPLAEEIAEAAPFAGGPAEAHGE
jgi:hypothetical protein